MKKNKKAFTLIELLAVIVILGVLTSLAVVGYTKYLNNTRKKAFEIAETNFADALEEAYVDCLKNPHHNTFCKNHDELYKQEYVYLTELIADGYIEAIKNPYQTDQSCDIEKSYISVLGNRDYQVCLICGSKKSDFCLND